MSPEQTRKWGKGDLYRKISENNKTNSESIAFYYVLAVLNNVNNKIFFSQKISP
jgi:hypothetical protein